MRLSLLMTIWVLSTVAQDTERVVDLSRASHEFPTHSGIGHCCSTAFDSSQIQPPKLPPAFPVALKIIGVRPNSLGDGTFVLGLRVKNIGSHAIELPVSPKEVRKGGTQTFVELLIRYPAGSETEHSASFAFADSKVPSSVIYVKPGDSVTFYLPLKSEAIRKSLSSERAQITVELETYSLDRNSKDFPDGVSEQLGNGIVSEPFALN